MAFYDDHNSQIITHEFYGQRNYIRFLDNDSFLAVMWTNAQRNDGIFEFLASCNDQGESGSSASCMSLQINDGTT